MKKFLKVLFLFIYIMVVGEFAIRAISSYINIYDIEMLKYAKKLKKRSNNPSLSHEHTPGRQYKLMGVDIKLNSLGHRNLDLEYQKNNYERRIHIIGSSITLGWGVEEKNTFSSILQKKLNLNQNIKKNIFVINGGIGNTNTQHHYHLLKDQVDLTKPDVIILQYFINDAEIIKKKKNNIILKYSYFTAFLYNRFKTYNFSGTLSNYYVQMYDENNLGWRLAIDSIKNLQNLSKRKNIKLVILFIPDFHNFSGDNQLVGLYEKIINKFEEMDITVINTYDSLSNEFKSDARKSWVASDDSHPNSKAHKLIANDLYNFLTDQKNGSFFE